VAVISLSEVMMPGLMFGVTIAKSLKSLWGSAQISLGHAVIKAPLILLIYFGIARLFQNAILEVILSVIGGSLIIWLGISMFCTQVKLVQRGEDSPDYAFVAGVLT